MQYLVILLLAGWALSINRNIGYENGVRTSKPTLTDDESISRDNKNFYRGIMAFVMLFIALAAAGGLIDLEEIFKHLP